MKHWNLYDYFTPPAGATGDYCHGNSATVNIERNEVYISCRWLGIFKLTYDDPHLVWHMPAAQNATGMGDVTFVPANSQFNDIHDLEMHDDGRLGLGGATHPKADPRTRGCAQHWARRCQPMDQPARRSPYPTR